MAEGIREPRLRRGEKGDWLGSEKSGNIDEGKLLTFNIQMKCCGMSGESHSFHRHYLVPCTLCSVL